MPAEGTKPVDEQLYVLIQRCIASDRQAQKQLYEQYASLLFGIILRYCDNQHNAEEILNDTFYRVFTNLKQYSFQGSFEGWMRRIAVNMITDHFRKYTKKIPPHQAELQEYSATVMDDAASQLSYKELLVVIQELPPTHRAVFNLFVFEQLPHKEIAALLEMSESNSRWHLNDARRRLKEKLSERR